jgi:hypothetical protein
MRLNINSNELVKFTVTLERLRKSALPSAIRGTLNDAAYDVKQKTMPAQARAEFVNRSPNFFKANSGVLMAKGFDVNTMKSTVGFMEDRLRLGKNNFAVRDLEEQEHSGSIGGRAYVPLDSARVSGPNTLVKPANRLSRILKANIVVARDLGHGNKKEQFVKAIFKAGIGGYVRGGNVKGEEILFRVDNISGPRRFSLTPLYDYKAKRKVNVDETGFMSTASLKSANKLDDFYKAQAMFWINKYKK